MNKRFIPIISFLMSVSLIIFVTLQIKWLKEYYGALDQDFSNKVSMAMEESVKKITEIEVNKYWNEDFRNLGKTLKANKNQAKLTTIQQTQDSANKKILTYQTDILQKQDWPISTNGDSLQVMKMYTNQGIERLKNDQGAPQILTPDLSSSIESGEYTRIQSSH